ncbi:uncharacterized protein V6R79_001031 [Siganus canaliculatus]
MDLNSLLVKDVQPDSFSPKHYSSSTAEGKKRWGAAGGAAGGGGGVTTPFQNASQPLSEPITFLRAAGASRQRMERTQKTNVIDEQKLIASGFREEPDENLMLQRSRRWLRSMTTTAQREECGIIKGFT